MSWKSKNVIACLSALALLLVAARAVQSQGNKPGKQQDQRSIKSVLVKVTGQSYFGLRYRKSAQLDHNEAKYILAYSCSTLRPRECPCRALKGEEVENSIAEQFFDDVEKLQDAGRKAMCCDHPYTQIEITYTDGSARKLTTSDDLMAAYEREEPEKRMKVFGQACR